MSIDSKFLNLFVKATEKKQLVHLKDLLGKR